MRTDRHDLLTVRSLYTKVSPKVSGLTAWSENCKLCSSLQLSAIYRYFVSQSSQFCRHYPLCCFSTSVYVLSVYFVIDSVRKLLSTPTYSDIRSRLPSSESFPTQYSRVIHPYINLYR